MQGAPHPSSLLMGDEWTKPYSREYAAFPASWLRSAKFWPTTGTSCRFIFFIYSIIKSGNLVALLDLQILL